MSAIGETPLTPEQWEKVQANTGLIGFVLGRRRTDAAEWDDAFQDGMFGLIRAVQLFDPERGTQFSTYATIWIRAAIQKGRRRAEGINFRSAEHNGAEYVPPLSLDAGVGQYDATLADALTDGEDPEEEALEGVTASALADAMAAVCRDELDRAVLLAIANGETWASVGRRFGVSGQTAINRSRRLLALLRHPRWRDRLGDVA